MTNATRLTKSTLHQLLIAHGFSSEEIDRCGLTHEAINTVLDKYLESREELSAAMSVVSNHLANIEQVHSTRARMKSPEHLIAKVARQVLGGRDHVTPENLHARITDLAGVRAIHLFKGDWRTIHDAITSTWNLGERPIAYVRAGDPKEWLDDLKSRKCKVSEHPNGYRSVHYLAKVTPRKSARIVEIQVRTIFEEGWSEVDHRLRYPNHSDDPQLRALLVIFNRLSGSADELGSYLNLMATSIEDQAKGNASREQQLQDTQSKLREALQQAGVSKKEIERLKKQVGELANATVTKNLGFGGFTAGDQSLLFSSTLRGSGVTNPTFGLSNINANPWKMPTVCAGCGKVFQTEGLTLSQYCDECRQSGRGWSNIGSSTIK